jgi:hypothetical protein
MTHPFKIVSAALLFGPLAADGTRCQTKGYCPVLPSLAASKLPSPEGKSVVVWYFNEGSKTVRGVQFELVMSVVRQTYAPKILEARRQTSKEK